MDAELSREDESHVEVYVWDNEDTKHTITFDKETGELVYHGQEAYSDDPESRSDRGNEMVDNARAYAKWFVDNATDYDTLPWHLDGETIGTVGNAVANLSEDELEAYFGDFHRQLAGEYTDDISQPHPDPIPAGEAEFDYIEYKIDIYLTEDGTEIEATSGIHAMYYAGMNDDRTIWGEDPFETRDPDARLEHVPFPVEWEVFQDFIIYHLKCQIRDCYLAMGVEPPKEYRVLGPGIGRIMERHMTRNINPPYHRFDADIEGYEARDSYNAGVLFKEMSKSKKDKILDAIQ